ncbi:nuclear transport factor 2 family protein [Nocardia carnea]|uniref:nuclear transport factor 2 family protein n=1 Tax=Nocardia carnea TaxID=37328 RepID=UPI0024556C08|nr:nuclear transport factor 2 family protein [Nocardia carnea]
MTHVIEDYYATVDSGELRDATAMLAEDIEFAMVLPTGVNRDRGRAAMFDYLNGRPKVNRKHRLLRVAVDGDMQFAHGAVTENDSVTTGWFVAAMHIGAGGRIDRYQVAFSADFALLPVQTPDEGAQA